MHRTKQLDYMQFEAPGRSGSGRSGTGAGPHERQMGLAMGPPLIVQAVEKVDQVVAKLQELQHNIIVTRNCLGSNNHGNGKERSKQITGSYKGQLALRGKSRTSTSKPETKRLPEGPPAWALQKSGLVDMREANKRNLPRMKDILAVEDHDVLSLPPAEGEWRRWSEPAGAVHQAVSEILIASQYAKEMAGIVTESLEEKQAFEEAKMATAVKEEEEAALRSSSSLSAKAGAAGVAGAPRKLLVRKTQTRSLTEKKIATKAAYKFKVVFPYECSPEKKATTCTSPEATLPDPSKEPSISPAKKDICPKARDIKRPSAHKATVPSVEQDVDACSSACPPKTTRLQPLGSIAKKSEAAHQMRDQHAATTRKVPQGQCMQELEMKAVPPQATTIKQPWNFSQGKASKVVLFSNPTFVPSKEKPEKSLDECGEKKSGWMDGGLRRLSLGLRPSSTGKNLPSLISALPSRRKSMDPAKSEATTAGPLLHRRSPKTGELPLPPGRLHRNRAQARPLPVSDASKGKAAPDQRKAPELCKLKTRNNNVGDVDKAGSGPTAAAAAAATKRGKSLPSPDMAPQRQDSSRDQDFASAESPGKENQTGPGCTPGVDLLRRSWSHGDRILALGQSPAGKSLLKRAQGWMSFQRTLSKGKASQGDPVPWPAAAISRSRTGAKLFHD